MKKLQFLIIGTILILCVSCQQDQKKDEILKNKEIAARYHELNLDDIDVILTGDFIGKNEKGRFTWNRENHRSYLTNDSYKKDSVFHQIAEGNWVATRFLRTMEHDEDTVKVEIMHFKRFENGKIAKIWEYGDSRQLETGEE